MKYKRVRTYMTQNYLHLSDTWVIYAVNFGYMFGETEGSMRTFGMNSVALALLGIWPGQRF